MNIRQIEQRWREIESEPRMLHGLRVVRDTDPAGREGELLEEIDASGIVGWDADKKQLVEHWYSSDGGYSSFRYFLGKRKDSWVGTFTWVYPDGKKLEGESVVQKKGKNKWEWKASYLEDGKKHTWRTINRRVK